MSPELPLHDEHYKLAVLLNQACDSMLRARQRELDPIHITNIEASTLAAIDALQREALPSRIARWINRRPNSTSSLLLRMEREGLVHRCYDLERANYVRIELTEHGEETLAEASKRITVHKIFGTLTAGQQDVLQDALLRIRDEALQILGEDKPLFPGL